MRTNRQKTNGADCRLDFVFAKKVQLLALSFVLIGALSTTVSMARALKEIRQSGVLIAALRPGAPPFSYEDHQDLRGIDVDLITVLADRIGVRPSFITSTLSSRRQPSADVTMGLAVAQGPNGNDLPKGLLPYLPDKPILLVNAPDEVKSKTGSPVVLSIGIARETFPAGFVPTSTNLQTRQAPKIVKLRNFAGALEAFRSKKVDALLLPLTQAIIAGRSAGRRVKLSDPQSHGFPAVPWRWSFAVSDPGLASDLRKHLEGLAQTSQLESVLVNNGLPKGFVNKIDAPR